MTGKQKEEVPLNSIHKAKQKQNAVTTANPVSAKPPKPTRSPDTEPQLNYVSDNEDEDDREDDEATVKQSNCSSSSPRVVDNDD